MPYVTQCRKTVTIEKSSRQQKKYVCRQFDMQCYRIPSEYDFRRYLNCSISAAISLKTRLTVFVTKTGYRSTKKRKVSHKEFLVFTKVEILSNDRIQSFILWQLGNVQKIWNTLNNSFGMDTNWIRNIRIMEIIRKVYNRQKYVYENDTPKDWDRIVRFNEWYVR